jgi:hypothetical protein
MTLFATAFNEWVSLKSLKKETIPDFGNFLFQRVNISPIAYNNYKASYCHYNVENNNSGRFVE